MRGQKPKANSVNLRNESDSMLDDNEAAGSHANSLGHINISSPNAKKGTKQINTSIGQHSRKVNLANLIEQEGKNQSNMSTQNDAGGFGFNDTKRLAQFLAPQRCTCTNRTGLPTNKTIESLQSTLKPATSGMAVQIDGEP